MVRLLIFHEIADRAQIGLARSGRMGISRMIPIVSSSRCAILTYLCVHHALCRMMERKARVSGVGLSGLRPAGNCAGNLRDLADVIHAIDLALRAEAGDGAIVEFVGQLGDCLDPAIGMGGGN